jgi:glycosyltransferase involved in cell wall biosynthesis
VAVPPSSGSSTQSCECKPQLDAKRKSGRRPQGNCLVDSETACKKIRILYLYAEVMGYTMATIRMLLERGIEVHVVHWDHKKLTPYQVPEWVNLHLYKRSRMTVEAIHNLIDSLMPAITVVSGWQDKEYMAAAKRQRARGGIVVTGFDDQWHGTLRQKLAAILGKLGYFLRFYSHAWVSGAYQFEYARRLGYGKQQIIHDLYSADLNLFHEAYRNYFEQKRQSYPHRFLFVGRFEPVKGLDTLLRAWKILGDKKGDWDLHLIGNGSLRTTLESTEGVIVKDFMPPGRLMQEVGQGGCFLLPSCGEPWGVVVHEFAAAGMPLILSDVVGAASTFLISGLNGYSFKPNNAQDLANQMAQITESTDNQLTAMAEHSYCLSQRITPETSAANLLSIIDNEGGET